MAYPEVLVLFGAGASYGCQGVSPYQPPLGNNLFVKLESQFPKTWGLLPTSIKKNFHQNFEYGMEVIIPDYDLIQVLMKDLARYFSKFYINNDKINLYSRFINDFFSLLQYSKMVITTINYDCIIEYAISNAGYKFNYWGVNQEIRLLKIHGSCNFFIIGATGGGKYRVRHPGQLIGQMKWVHPNQVHKTILNIPPPPCMSLYARGKGVISAQNRILDLQQEFQSDIMHADIVVVIGVNPNMEDDHIWDYLSKTNASIYFIGNKSRFNDWKTNFRKSLPSKFLSNRFHLGYDDLRDRLFTYFTQGRIDL